MFEGKDFIGILEVGGWTLYVLLFASVLSVSVILFKFFEYFAKSRISRAVFIQRIKSRLQPDNVDNAMAYCEKFNIPVANVIKAGLTKYKESGSVNVEAAIEREILIETIKLEKYTTIVGTIGSISVYIGLFGTVLGIIKSFHDISKVGSGGISVVIGGVSEALVATAAGLCVAIPAVIAYNFFMKVVDKFIVDMEYCASVTEEMLELYVKNEKK